MILHGEGKESLPHITQEILSNPYVDGGIVRGCINYEEKKELDRAHQINDEGLVAATVQSLIPQISEVQQQIRKFWEFNGYSDFELADYLYFTDYVPYGRGIVPHIDYYDSLHNFVQAGVSFSLSLGEKDSGAVIKVSRPKEACFRHNDGSMNVKALLGWQSLVGSNLVDWEEVTVGWGDMFILPQHSSPAGHGVVASETRDAYILDYLAFRKDPHNDEVPNKDVSS